MTAGYWYFHSRRRSFVDTLPRRLISALREDGLERDRVDANERLSPLAHIYPRGKLDVFTTSAKLYSNYIIIMARTSAQKSTAHKRRISSDHIAGAKRAKQLDESSDELSEEEVSEFEDDELTTPSADEDEDSDDFDDRKTRRSQWVSQGNRKKNEPGSGSRKKGTPRNRLSAKDLSKPGVKTGLGPGTQVVIKKPKARDPGDTPYSDETIHPNTMLFLEDLAANNNRQWLKSELSSS